MSADFSHERERLYGLVDRFIATQEEEGADYENCRVDDAALCVAVSGEDLDGDLVEAVLYVSESKQGYKRVGLMVAAADSARQHLAGGDE